MHQRFWNEQVNVHWEQCCNLNRIHSILSHCPGLTDLLHEWVYVVNCINAWKSMKVMPNLAQIVKVQVWHSRCLLATDGSRKCITEITHHFYDLGMDACVLQISADNWAVFETPWTGSSNSSLVQRCCLKERIVADLSMTSSMSSFRVSTSITLGWY